MCFYYSRILHLRDVFDVTSNEGRERNKKQGNSVKMLSALLLKVTDKESLIS